MDTSHLTALMTRLSHERARLAKASTAGELAVRTTWVYQLEREIASEAEFLGIANPLPIKMAEMTDEDILNELMGN